MSWFWQIKRYLLRLIAVVGLLLIMAIVLVGLANCWINWRTKPHIINEIQQCPYTEVGIVFGTSNRLAGGSANPFYYDRIKMAAYLWQHQYVSHLLLSGDNRSRYYNEPLRMSLDLQHLHIPVSSMTLDFAGLSTFDTLVRAREVFGIEHALLITQAWHLPRALYIAQQLGIKAYGCILPESKSQNAYYVRFREWLANTMTLGDLYLWRRKPHFLGKLIAMPVQQSFVKSERSD